MKTYGFASTVLLFVVILAGCATTGISPIKTSDASANRVYWDDHPGDGYRIKISRDAGQLGSMCFTQVYVDGKLAADIGLAESAMFKVSPGQHMLRASPTQASSLCRKFYSAPQFQMEVVVDGVAGDVKSYRYGFEGGSGLPFLVPAGN